MIRPHGADDLTPRYVDNETQHKALVSEAEFQPSITLNTQPTTKHNKHEAR